MVDFFKLEKTLNHKNSKILEYYSSGVSHEKVSSVFSSLNLKPTPDLINFYKWKNGLNNWAIPTGKSSIFPYGVFTSIDLSAEYFKKFKELNFEDNFFFPILVDDNIFINLNDDSKDFGSIFISNLYSEGSEKAYTTLKTFIDTHIRCYNEDVFYFDEDGILEIDHDKEFEISADINVDCPYWIE